MTGVSGPAAAQPSPRAADSQQPLVEVDPASEPPEAAPFTLDPGPLSPAVQQRLAEHALAFQDALDSRNAARIDTSYQQLAAALRAAVTDLDPLLDAPVVRDRDRVLRQAREAGVEVAADITRHIARANGATAAEAEGFANRQRNTVEPLVGVSGLVEFMATKTPAELDKSAMVMRAQLDVGLTSNEVALPVLSVVQTQPPSAAYLAGAELARTLHLQQRLDDAWTMDEESLRGAVDYAQARVDLGPNYAAAEASAWMPTRDHLANIWDHRRPALEEAHREAEANVSDADPGATTPADAPRFFPMPGVFAAPVHEQLSTAATAYQRALDSRNPAQIDSAYSDLAAVVREALTTLAPGPGDREAAERDRILRPPATRACTWARTSSGRRRCSTEPAPTKPRPWPNNS
ncbi:hypothetical protein ACFQX6_67040 [Streptosporangium lutulentum]